MAPSASSAEIKWTDAQLKGHEHANLLQNQMLAWWWAYGFPTHLTAEASQDSKKLFWCCIECNKSGEKLQYVYDITKGRGAPRRHLESVHKIDKVASEEPSGLGTRVSTSLRKQQDFSLSVFRGLLLQFFVHDNIAFRKVDSKHFKAMLTYLEGRLEGNIGSRFSVRRWILDAYVKHTKVVKAKLAKAQSLIHLSFDLWTSRSLLSLNGIVVHFVDEGFEARTFLLALPQQKGKHSGTRIADTVRNLLLINIDDWSTKD
jgi:hypothetical protein